MSFTLSMASLGGWLGGIFGFKKTAESVVEKALPLQRQAPEIKLTKRQAQPGEAYVQDGEIIVIPCKDKSGTWQSVWVLDMPVWLGRKGYKDFGPGTVLPVIKDKQKATPWKDISCEQHTAYLWDADLPYDPDKPAPAVVFDPAGPLGNNAVPTTDPKYKELLQEMAPPEQTPEQIVASRERIVELQRSAEKREKEEAIAKLKKAEDERFLNELGKHFHKSPETSKESAAPKKAPKKRVEKKTAKPVKKKAAKKRVGRPRKKK